MALTDKNIVITPNVGQASDPQIVFSGADATSGPNNITLRVYPTDGGTLSFEGTAGQLFSLTNSLSGTIYSVNDVSGIPSIEVLDTGLVKLAEYGGNVLVGTGTDNGTDKLQVNGSVTASVIKSTVASGTAPFTVTSTNVVSNLNADLLDGNHASAFALSSHTHDYLPLTGGTVTGNLNLGNTTETLTRTNYPSTNLSKINVRPSMDMDNSQTIGTSDALNFIRFLSGTAGYPISNFHNVPLVIKTSENPSTGIGMLHTPILAYAVGLSTNYGQVFITSGTNDYVQQYILVGSSDSNPSYDSPSITIKGKYIEAKGELIVAGAFREKVINLSTNPAIDLSLGNYFYETITGATTFTVSNVPSSGRAASFILDLTNGGSATITWWAGVKWAGGTAPTLTASGRDVLGFFTYDGGTTWTGLLLGKDVK